MDQGFKAEWSGWTASNWPCYWTNYQGDPCLPDAMGCASRWGFPSSLCLWGGMAAGSCVGSFLAFCTGCTEWRIVGINTGWRYGSIGAWQMAHAQQRSIECCLPSQPPGLSRRNQGRNCQTGQAVAATVFGTC